MSDVSITDLIAKVRANHPIKVYTEHGIPVFDEFDRSTETRTGCSRCKSHGPCDASRLADALEAAERETANIEATAKDWMRQIDSLTEQLAAAERDAQQAEDQANNLAGDVAQLEQKLAALEAVTVPTDDYCEAGHWLDGAMPKHKRGETCPAVPTENADIYATRCLPCYGTGRTRIVNPERCPACKGTGSRPPVPVEPEYQYFIERPMFAEGKWNEGLYDSLGAANDDMKPEYQMYRRTKAIPAGEWEDIA